MPGKPDRALGSMGIYVFDADYPELNIYDREWPVWTYQEQLPPAKFVPDRARGGVRQGRGKNAGPRQAGCLHR